jgi:thymidylate synthase
MATFASVEEVQQWALETLLKDGEPVAPRGQNTVELIAVSMTIREPRRRCVTNAERCWSFPAAVGELCWHLAGSRDLRFVSHYLKRWCELSDDPIEVRGSCYGYRIFGRSNGGQSQWERMLALLHADASSRRAVLDLYDPEVGLRAETKDSPCATSLQFLIRRGRLHLVTHMRSNDVIWGLPYDVFVFTMLQELLASELGVQLGSYLHVVGSLHLYERHIGLARRIVGAGLGPAFEMPSMSSHKNLHAFLRLEEQLRVGEALQDEEVASLDEYWRDLASVLNCHRVLKLERGHAAALAALPKTSAYAPLLRTLWTRQQDEA